ncbi:MAG: PA14 domain-containing protein [Vicinamibacterales bacterium]
MPPPGATRLLSGLLWFAAMLAAFAAGESVRAEHGLRMTAYDTATWEGRPVLERLDASLSNELLGNPPFPQWSVYSIEWQGFLAVDAPGAYTFWTRTDDGSQVEVDGALVVDNAGQHTVREASGQIHLDAGIHPMRVRYFQAGERYTLSVLWAREGEALGPIPPERLLPREMSYAAYRARPLVPAAVALVTFGLLALLLHRATPRIVARAAHPLAWRAERALEAVSRPRTALLLILAVGVAVRLAVLAANPPVLWPDTVVFRETAREILAGQWRGHDAYRTMVYPFLLAPLLATIQGPVVATVVVALQQGFGLLSASLLYLVFRRVMSPRAALAGALLFVVHGLQLFYELSVLTEALFIATLAVTLLAAVRAYERPSTGRMAWLGLMAALLVLVRPVAQWYVVCLVAAGLIAWRTVRPRWPAIAAMSVCVALPLAGWMSVNLREYGFFGVALGRGMGLYTRVFTIDGLEPPPDSAHPEMRELWKMARTLRWSANRVGDELNYVRGFSSARADDLMFVFARETVLAHPVAFTLGTLRQWAVQVGEPDSGVRTCLAPGGRVLCSGRADEAPLETPTLHGAVGQRLRRVVVDYVSRWAVPMKPVAILALIGWIGIAFARRVNAAGVLLGLTVIYFTGVPALTQVAQDRFRLPSDGIVFALAAAGVGELVTLSARRSAAAPPGPTASERSA